MTEIDEKKFITSIVRKPAKQGDDYHFSIPRNQIGLYIDPNKRYEIRIYELPETLNIVPATKKETIKDIFEL